MNRIVTLAADLMPSLMSGNLSSPTSSTSSSSSSLPSLPFLTKDPLPDALRSVPELIESRGFICETHEVTTDDGYILCLHRIVHPFNTDKNDLRPILLGHGIAAHSGHWLLNSDDGFCEEPKDTDDDRSSSLGPSSSSPSVGNNLGFVLANSGYDVWMLNWRGNRYSQKHSNFTTEDSSFWNFTVDDLAEYDLPCFIRFILQQTQHQTLGYVGMSQGSNVMFALLSSKPSFNNKIKPFIALCPAIRISNAIRVPIPILKVKIPVPTIVRDPCLKLFNSILGITGSGKVIPFADFLAQTLGSGHVFQHYLNHLIYLFSASFFDLDIDKDRMSVYSSQLNFALTRKNLAHLVQTIMGNEFCKFDYGTKKNSEIYGKDCPPSYDLRNITNQTVALIYSKNDEWASVCDFDHIANSLKVPLLDDYLIPEPKWSHYDFTFGRNLGRIVNQRILQILTKSSKIPDSEVAINSLNGRITPYHLDMNKNQRILSP